MPKLLLIRRGEVKKQFHVPRGGIGIGRSPVNQIRINAPSVSERHARIYTTQHGSSIKDLNSALGTFVNDQWVDRYDMRDNDIILIGSYKFRYQQDIVDKATARDGARPGVGARQEREILQHAEPSTGAASLGEHKDSGGASPQAPAQLLVMNGVNRNRTIPLLKERTVLGSKLERSLIIEAVDDGYVAERACPDTVIEINGAPLVKAIVLEDGDKLIVDGIGLVFRRRTGSEDD